MLKRTLYEFHTYLNFNILYRFKILFEKHIQFFLINLFIECLIISNSKKYKINKYRVYDFLSYTMKWENQKRNIILINYLLLIA